MGDLFRRPLLVVDTETTGFTDDPEAQPWEIGAVLLAHNGSEIGTFSAVGCPAVLHPRMDKALSIGGVTAAELRAHPPMTWCVEAFQTWLAEMSRNTDEPRAWTAFNIAFDRPMLARIGVNVETWAPCIMERAKPIMGEAGALPWFNKYNDWKMPKLSEAAAFFNVPQQEPAHRALADARTAGLIAIALQRRALAKQ